MATTHPRLGFPTQAVGGLLGGGAGLAIHQWKLAANPRALPGKQKYPPEVPPKGYIPIELAPRAAIARPAALYAAVAGTFHAINCTAEQVRQRKDGWNAAIAGCAAGSIWGIPSKAPQSMALGCLAGAFVGCVAYTQEPSEGFRYNPQREAWKRKGLPEEMWPDKTKAEAAAAP